MCIRAGRLALTVALVFVAGATAQEPTLRLTQRSRTAKGDSYEVVNKSVTWDPKQTAVIVCDMWDTHHCLNAVRRVEELAPHMNRVLERVRSQGVLVIHAPSSCMDAYKDRPGRKRAEAARKATNLPTDIHKWCTQI